MPIVIHVCDQPRCRNNASHSYRLPKTNFHYYVCRECLPKLITHSAKFSISESELDITEITEMIVQPPIHHG